MDLAPGKDITPLDPDSDAGRQVANDLSEVLARAWLRIQAAHRATPAPVTHGPTRQD